MADTLLPVMAESLHDHLGLGITTESSALGGEILLDEHSIGVGLAGALDTLVLAGTAGRARLLEGALLGHTHLAGLAGRAHHLAGNRLGLGAGLLPHRRDGAGELGERGTGHRSLCLLPVHLAEVGVGINTAGRARLLGHAADRLADRLLGSRATAHRLLRSGTLVGLLGVSTLVGLLGMGAATGGRAFGGLGTSASCHFSINEKNKKKFFYFFNRLLLNRNFSPIF